MRSVDGFGEGCVLRYSGSPAGLALMALRYLKGLRRLLRWILAFLGFENHEILSQWTISALWIDNGWYDMLGGVEQDLVLGNHKQGDLLDELNVSKLAVETS